MACGPEFAGALAMIEAKKFFADAFRHMGNNRTVPEVEVRFYPYAGLHHTIRVRRGGVYVVVR